MKTYAYLGWAGLLLLSGGCNLEPDPDVDACKTKADCDERTTAHETYVCKEGICVHESCAVQAIKKAGETDAEAQARADEYCQGLESLGGTAATAICENDPVQGEKTCLPPICLETADCETDEACSEISHRCERSGPPTRALPLPT